jgi:ABC-type multidrug transport system ATPase subunit
MEEYKKLYGNFNESEVDLTWEDLKCKVKTPTGEKQILKGISGHAFHGDFLVIMGSSGAGKTTLLNILSKRLKPSKDIQISGTVLANNQSLNTISFSNYSGYVTQEDLLIPTMTVFETLLFVARLKTTYPNKVQKVNDLIKELKLEKCKNTLIGNEYIKGVSGGERKRTSIGVELITNPSILFLDEPTSGLDSYTAHIVCTLLLEKAKEGKTIISTIHQPNSDIFNLFDKFMLMADGQVVYYGLASESTKFFADHGLICPPLDNPADYYMEILHIKDSSNLSEEESSRIRALISAGKSASSIPEPSKEALSSETQYNSKFSTQLYYLTQRAFLRILRNPMLLLMRLIIISIIILVSSIVFRDCGDPQKESEFSAAAGIIFFFIIPTIMINLLTTVLTFPSQLPIFEKEYQSNIYGVLPYYLSITIVDFFNDLLFSSILVSSTYWIIDFDDSGKAIFYFYAVIFLNMSIGGGMGNLLGSLFRDTGRAVMLIPPVFSPNVNFGGFSRGKNLPSSFKWLEQGSSIFYAFQTLMRTQFENKVYTDCTCNSSTDCSPCDPLDIYDIRTSLTRSFLTLIGMAILLRVLGLLVNLYRAKKLKSSQ